MPDKWQQQLIKVAGAIIAVLVVTISAMGFSMRDDGKEVDRGQTNRIERTEQNITSLKVDDAKHEARMEAIMEMLREIKADIKEIKDKR